MIGDEPLPESVPVLEETVRVEKVIRETDRVLIRTTVQERTEYVDVALSSGEAVIERVPVNRFVETVPTVREEGDVIIVPLLEEVLVTEKKLLLKEEIRIHRKVTVENVHEPVRLRSEQVSLERSPATETAIEDTDE